MKKSVYNYYYLLINLSVSDNEMIKPYLCSLPQIILYITKIAFILNTLVPEI